ncbi:LysR family transcriptional regulator [Methylobacterium sp. AMS5]|uniref:LysR family transcriptional regulator n=1 Tax=Methylobacterium sp. AMS5 TaxID=925818 RepID=UPI00074F875D|nr:LysR family transcriptional regulator [Methylobacterium sp. AMS5]AMB43952.1 transcriptional regulator [Methylobacterium sp. AMS5]
MDLRGLHAFRIVAEASSMTAAAERLGTVQSALSARIGQFETAIGMRLFERLPRGVRLTAAGARLLPYAEQMEILAAEAMRAARGTETAGPFRLGAIAVAATTVLPPVLARLLADHEGLDLHVATGVSRDLDALLAEGKLDAAILGHRSIHAAIISRPLDSIPLALLRPAGMPAETAGQAFTFAAGCICRERLNQVLRERRIGARIVELGSVEGILGCVAAGLGVALLPEMLARQDGIAAERVGRLDLFVGSRPEAEGQVRAFVSAYRACRAAFARDVA